MSTRTKEGMPVLDKHLVQVLDFAQVMLAYHSDESLLHFQRVKRYSSLLCLKYNELFPQNAIPKKDIPFITEGAKLHDIGKISIPDELLHKKSPLTPEEFAIVKQHTLIGAQIVDRMSDICHLGKERRLLHDICLYHHERYDGSGYPEGLVGDTIPLCAQIVSIAEVYDALTEQNYKAAVPHDEAMRAIIANECGMFNPRLLTCLDTLRDDYETILNTDEEHWELIEGAYTNRRTSYWKTKRMLDVMLSTGALVVLSPLLLCIAAAIKIDDPMGPVIFKQTRLGRHKKPFTMYKFRTMCVDAEARKKELLQMNEKDGPAFKIANDPRITRVGRFLRKTSLDELPQLYNVLKGDMSIVGPRPPLPEEVQQYSRYQEMRLSITPGLTCVWQAQPDRDNIGFDSWVDMDVSYIGTRSLKKDCEIILKTIASVFHKSGH